MSRQILSGWKEISSTFGGVSAPSNVGKLGLGLPVYRPIFKDKTAVVAFSDELDCWISRAAPGGCEQYAVPNDIEENDAGLLRMLDNMITMGLESAELSSQMRLLQEQLQQSLKIYQYKIASRTRAQAPSVPSRDMGPVLTFRPRRHGLALGGTAFQADASGMADQRHRRESASSHGRVQVASHKR
jgi:hypothetical protein